RFLHLLGSERADQSRVLENFDERLIRDGVELLDGFSLYIGLTGGSQNIEQASPAKVTGEDFPRQADLGQQRGKFPGRGWIACLGLSDESGECKGFAVHECLQD